jgi:hypothetical protein
MDFSTQPRVAAVYLRCFPHDVWQMTAHRELLDEYAAWLGLPTPSVFLDNGVSSRDHAAQRHHLLASVRAGFVQVVLIPGRWVFSLDAAKAQQAAGELTDAGCTLLELPPQWNRPARTRQLHPVVPAPLAAPA